MIEGRTRAEIRRDALEKRVSALSLQVARLREKTVPFVNSSDVIRAADLKIERLELRLKPLRDEIRGIEIEMSKARNEKMGGIADMPKNSPAMRPLPKTQFDRLADIYARVPAVQCKGLCQESCGPIALYPVEVDHLRRRGLALPVIDSLETMNCSALSADGQCSIYEARPLICRLWGAVQRRMECPWGCTPAPAAQRWLSQEQASALVAEVRRLSWPKDDADMYWSFGDGVSTTDALIAINRYLSAGGESTGLAPGGLVP